MFTGIVREVGRVERRIDSAHGNEFTVSAPLIAREFKPGDSVAVSGICQTVEKVEDDAFTFTAVGETLRRTNLRDVGPGGRVNLERAATPTTALGGHLVQGHVDGTGRVERFELVRTVDSTGSDQEDTTSDRYLTVALPEDIFAFVVEKGSVAIDGVSLTIAAVGPGKTITMTIIPHTLRETTMGGYKTGTRVNIEVDIIAKYVQHFVANMRGGEGLLRQITRDIPER